MFGMKPRSEIQLSDDEYKKARREFFRLKRKLFFVHTRFMAIFSYSFVGLAVGAVMVLSLLEGHIPNWHLAIFIIVFMPFWMTIVFAIAEFLFSSPLPPAQK